MNQSSTTYATVQNDEQINFGELLDALYLDRKLVALIAIVITFLGIGYALIAKPVYEADLAVQVEDSPTSAKGMLGDMAAMFDTKTEASAEMEILRSRMVVSKAVDNLGLYIQASPRYVPLIGSWLAQKSKELSTPMLGGYVYGNEAIKIDVLNVPEEMQDEKFKLTYDGHNGFTLSLSKHDISIQGRVGEAIKQHTELGDVEVLVSSLSGNPGSTFKVVRHSRIKTISSLQDDLVIAEKGKQSGVIGIKLNGEDPSLTAQILNEIGSEYIRQNVHRKSEEAEKSLAFLDHELPNIKRALEASENKYNSLRKARGTIDLEAEGQALLDQSVAIETKLLDAQQKRDELLTNFTPQHPSVVTLDKQILLLVSQRNSLQNSIKTLPGLQQDILSLERDVKVNTQLYTTLLDSSQQLNLLKASKTGTARMIDPAAPPEEPVKPKRVLIIILAIVLGVFAGITAAIVRKAMRSSIDNPKIIEDATGLPVYATILESSQQEEFALKIKAKQPGIYILADSHPDDLSIESLRSFRVALQFAMLDAQNNRVMITGASPGIGKSFIAANLAVVLAQAGKRVLLMDMDLHKGHLNQYFGLPREGGISELLSADKTLGEVTHKSVLNNLDFLTIGARASNPSALFLSGRLPSLLEQVSQLYDVILIDAPPALLVSDVSVIGANVGTTFLVARDNMSTIPEIQAVQKRLDQARVTIKGVLFNGQLQRISNSYGYGYGYSYGKYSNYKKPNN